MIADAPPKPAPSEAPIVVGGDIRRITIITIRENPCASYLARRLRGCGAEISYVSQTHLKVELRSRAYFLRLLRRRGLLPTIDNLLLYGAYLGREALRSRKGSLPEPLSQPVFAPDPTLREEPWLRFIEMPDVNSSDGRSRLAELAPDLILLGGAPILGRRTIELARVACINPHCGIVPRYAGGSPSDWAIYERRFEDIGYTIHLVESTVDGGPVLHQERIAWDPRASNATLWPILAQAMYDRLSEIARDLVAGRKLVATPQGPARVLPPAGLVVRTIAELRRRAYARRAL